MMVDNKTHPAMVIAKGGQNWLPASISGRKPPNVVTVVDTMWRLESLTTQRMAKRPPFIAPL